MPETASVLFKQAREKESQMAALHELLATMPANGG